MPAFTISIAQHLGPSLVALAESRGISVPSLLREAAMSALKSECQAGAQMQGTFACRVVECVKQSTTLVTADEIASRCGMPSHLAKLLCGWLEGVALKKEIAFVQGVPSVFYGVM